MFMAPPFLGYFSQFITSDIIPMIIWNNNDIMFMAPKVLVAYSVHHIGYYSTDSLKLGMI